MAITQNTFTGNGSNLGPFSFTFKWLEPTDIKVTVAGVLKTAGTHYNLQNLNYTTKNGGEVLFTAGNAPANNATIVVYRQTDDTNLASTFYSGSAIRAQDLNDNFTQGLYVTQEANNNVITANATANTALTNSNTAISSANSAVSTANTASSNASTALSTANTASSNASAAVSTANTASSNATAAVNTANSAASTASTALSTANTALSTANTASSNASTALSTANTASTNASAAVSTANTASSNASSAVNTANTASSNASTALSTANTAISTANAAASAVANAILYSIVANVAAIPASPANNDAVEITDSTGIQSFTPLSGLPAGFVGSSSLSVRLVYTSAGSTWNWIQYFPNDPESRYLKLSGGTLTGQLKADDSTSVASPVIAFDGDTNTGIAHTGNDELALVTGGTARLTIDPSGNVAVAGGLTKGGNNVVTTGDTGTVTSTMIADGTIVDADINASAEIAVSKLADGAARQLLQTDAAGTGVEWTDNVDIPGTLDVTGAAVFDSTANIAGNLTVDTNTLFVDATNNRVGVGTTTPGFLFDALKSSAGTVGRFQANGTDSNISIKNSGREGVIGSDSSQSYLLNTDAYPWTFWTNSTERVRIDSSGRVGIGTTSPQQPLHIKNGGSSACRLLLENTGSSAVDATQIWSQNNDLVLNAGSNERARIDSSGRLLVGTSSDIRGSKLQVLSTGNDHQSLIGGNQVAQLELCRSSNSAGGAGIVASGDIIGRIECLGNDGSAYRSAARIEAVVDGTPGANDMPGRLVFSTTADGASSPTERMRIDSAGRLTVSVNAADWSQTLFNDGNNVNRYGLRIQCGTDDSSGTNYAVAFQDGDNTNQGYITFTSGTVTYGAFTAHHPCILPEADNETGYPYGTLLEITSIEYTQKDGHDTERGILYNVRKTQTANSRAALGAYGSSMNGGPDGETNRHQALVLGDGHILCNNSGGNIKVGDGICSSATPGIGQKATATPSMAIGIAQEDVTFADGEEVKLVAVQYGVRQFIPWGD